MPEELALTNEQLQRNKDIDSAVQGCLRVLLENPELKWDQKLIEDTVWLLIDGLSCKGFKIRRPGIYIDDATGKPYFEE